MDESVQNNPEMSDQANALSIFGPGGAGNDFPVLKAFQQYIDAEQAKARKRMLGLSAFFVVLLLVVVVTFTLITVAVINRNQSLSDRLLDIALRDKGNQQPVVNVQPPPQTIVQQPAAQEASIMKPILEKLENLATAMISAKQQPAPAPAPVVVTTSAPVAPSAYQPFESAETQMLKEELKKQQEALRLELEKMNADRRKSDAEEQKKAAIEQHRRRLYPEYYAREDAKKATLTVKAKGEVPSRETLPDVPPSKSVIASPSVARPTVPASEQFKKGATPPSKPAAANPVLSQPASKPKAENKSGAIDYFSKAGEVDEELNELLRNSKTAPRKIVEKTVPASPTPAVEAPARTTVPATSQSQKKIEEKKETQTLNVGKTEDDSIPFIVNMPATSKK